MTAGPPGGRELTGVKMAGAGRTHDAWMSLAPAAEPALREQFPALPDDVLWKTELLFRGVRFTPALAEAAEEGAAPNFWPYRRRDAHGHLESIAVPYLFHLAGGGVARVRVEDGSPYEVRRDRAVVPLLFGSEDDVERDERAIDADDLLGQKQRLLAE